jgi:hypothetical protein
METASPGRRMLIMPGVQEEWANVFLLAFASFIGERGSALHIAICEAAIMHPPISGTMTRYETHKTSLLERIDWSVQIN